MVLVRSVAAIDSLGTQFPFVPIDGLPYQGHISHIFEADGTSYILEVRIGCDFKIAEICPLVGIANLHVDAFKFVEGLGFGLVAHPVESFDALGKSQSQVLDKVLCTLFGLSRKKFLHIKLTNCHLQIVGCLVGHTEPAWFLGLLAVKEFVEEIEVFGDEVVAEKRGTVGDDLPS